MALIVGTETGEALVGTGGADTINGLGGDDTITGGAGDDLLTGGLGNDIFVYSSRGYGVDIISDFSDGDRIDLRAYNVADVITLLPYVTQTVGGVSIQTFFNGSTESIFIRNLTISQLTSDRFIFNSSLAGLNIRTPTGGSTFFGGNGDDVLTGNTFSDQLNGGAGNDTIDGGSGNDTLFGGTGSDRFVYSSRSYGNDTIGDFGREDLIDLRRYNVGDLATIAPYISQVTQGVQIQTFFAGGEEVILLQNLILDQLTSDRLIFNTSSATIFLNAPLEGGVIFGGNGNDVIDGSNSIDELNGGAGNDTLRAFARNDVIRGGAGNDALDGGEGNDSLDGGLGVDTLDGGVGFDYASYAHATSGLTLFMGGGTFNTGEANGDTHTSIEGLIGSNFSDIIGGNAGTNELRGLNGNDFIYGRGGIDTLLGGDGNDVLDGGADGDRLDGGAGIDVAYYRDATSGLTASLQTAIGTGEALGDTYTNIENIWGSDFNDVLAGDNNGGQVYGFLGNDSLSGLGGDDFFYGGDGADTLDGGAGVDNFFFLAWQDQTNQFGTLERAEGGDTFTDFTSGTDRIILSRYWFGFGNIGGPAAALTETHANFVTNGVVGTTRPSLIWNTSNRTLSFDADGTGGRAAVLLGTLQAGATLTLGDIWTA